MKFTEQTFEFRMVTAGVSILLLILSFMIGVLVGQEYHPNSRILNKKEWPCSMPVVIHGEPECTDYERVYLDGKK